VFEDWRAEREFDSPATDVASATSDDLEDSLRERRDALQSAPLADFEARHLEAMVTSIATQLRLRRSHARLQAAALEQAETLRAARGGAPPDPVADTPVSGDVDELHDTYAETARRQRELQREYQVASGHRSSPQDAPGAPSP
jgi:hypothetical protein